MQVSGAILLSLLSASGAHARFGRGGGGGPPQNVNAGNDQVSNHLSHNDWSDHSIRGGVRNGQMFMFNNAGMSAAGAASPLGNNFFRGRGSAWRKRDVPYDGDNAPSYPAFDAEKMSNLLQMAQRLGSQAGSGQITSVSFTSSDGNSRSQTVDYSHNTGLIIDGKRIDPSQLQQEGLFKRDGRRRGGGGGGDHRRGHTPPPQRSSNSAVHSRGRSNSNMNTGSHVEMNANSGIISNSGNTVGVQETCAVFAKRDLTFPEPAPVSELTKRAPGCVCQCNRRRSVVEVLPTDQHPVKATVESGCKVLRDEPSGAYYYSGSCSNSKVGKRALTEVFTPYPLAAPSSSYE